MSRYDVLIVGTGHAGAQAAIALRQHKFAGSIALVGDEPELPYERPPLSKEYLAGEKPFERMLIRSAAFWAERNVAMVSSRLVTRIDPASRHVVTAGCEAIEYGALIWAAGGRPRRLGCEGADLAGVHGVRTRADVDAIRARLGDVRQVAVIGGGYVGLETAAVMAGLGRRVCIVEAQDRVLSRVAGEPLSRFFEAEHRSHGVELRLGSRVASIEGGGGRVTGLRLEGGAHVPADLLIVGIGIEPSVEALLDAGATGGDGVLVDDRCRTSLPNVFAIGDCALHANRFAAGARVRLESVQNATDQATVAAKTILGLDARYDAIPWFWSTQYDLKLQTIGLSAGHDAALVRGAPASRSFSVVYLRDGRVIALDCVNATKDYVQGRKLVLDGTAPDPSLLADPEVPLKELAAASLSASHNF